MVNEATISRLYEMKLSAMAASYRQQTGDNGITDPAIIIIYK